ncbi:trypsin-like peptidase domain-containing protein [Leucobacter sp. UT-8R-CII-1-4]|uniref:S1C family serine protease n=1 Tax=Leucobacter sp. UT-8R-CII-1-4 TaxID=3040075 RepID=UPI0024A7EE41|nr:trypsin-like peptidase domain-containing protein [Leucobacter sp. UT-8R-CII-1-4]MDI6023095.1 trypsin-like peptidase domain-containing protein [Leucobacter sp. UT-8R-CII-1-4]
MTTTPEPETPQQPEQTPQQPVQQQGEFAQQTTPLPDMAQGQPADAQPAAAQPAPQMPQAPQAQQPAQPVQPAAQPQSQYEQHQQLHQPQQNAYYAPHPSHLADQGVPVPEASGTAEFTASGATAQATQAPAETPKKSRAGVFFAGIAIGAVVAGVVGGGAGALVAANQGSSSFAQAPATGRVTFNNADTSTNVSAVALAATPSVVTLSVSGESAGGSGSGVIYSEDGYIITNAHVVTLDGKAGSNPEIRVSLSDGRVLDGEIVGVDPFADLAVVKVKADNLVPVEVADSSEINVGDLTVAIGAPLNLSNTVTSGVVSALNRGIAVGSSIIPDQPNEQQDQPDPNGEEELPWYRFGTPDSQGQQPQQPQQQTTTRVTLPVIQTDASINPGNSGGALLNANAELIGINVAIASNGADSSTAGSDGLGFAIPSNMVTRVADALIAGEQPSHGLLGIGVNDSSADTDEDRNFAGGLISELVAGGPAANAGLKVGDVITAVDGVPADSGTTVSALVRMHAGGDKVTISYVRGGKPGEAEVTLGTLEW